MPRRLRADLLRSRGRTLALVARSLRTLAHPRRTMGRSQ